MKISVLLKGSTLEIALSGELDHHGAKEVMASSTGVIEENLPQSCVLNLKEVGFMDSSGIALILNINKRIANIGGSFGVINAAKQPMKVIRASGIDRIVSIKTQ